MSSFYGLLYYISPFAFLFFIYRIYKDHLTKKRKAALRNQVVVITGAGSGLGRALSHEFYEIGCKVVLASCFQNELERVKEELLSKKLPLTPPEPVVIKVDVSKTDECEHFVKTVLDTCGHADIVINCAAMAHIGSNLETKIELHKKVINTNYFGTVIVSNGLLPKMVERKSGQIVIINSVLGRIGMPERSPYCASKHALIAYADSLRAEVHNFNVHVTVIFSGFLKTQISATAIRGDTGKPMGVLEEGVEKGYTPEYAAKKFLDIIVNREKEAVKLQPILLFAMVGRYIMTNMFFNYMANRKSSLSS